MSIVSHPPIPLPSLSTGETATVDHIVGRPDHVHRLHELGLSAGAEVEMVRRGSPCIIRLAGQKLCFRTDRVAHVLVIPGNRA